MRLKLQEKFPDNRGKNICGIFNILTQIPCIISEREINYYYQKVNIRIASQVIKPLKIKEISGKPLKCLQLIGKCSTGHSNDKFGHPKASLKQIQKANNKDVLYNTGFTGFCKKLFLMIEGCIYILKMVSFRALIH